MQCVFSYYPKPRYNNHIPKTDHYESLLVYARQWITEEQCYGEIRTLTNGHVVWIGYWDRDEERIIETTFDV